MPMRQLEGFKTAGAFTDLMRIEVMDEPNKGNANCRYDFYLKIHGEWQKANGIKFQNGPLKEIEPLTGVITEKQPNGIVDEGLLAVVIDRLEGFQNGPFLCEENAAALMHLQKALGMLKKRTAKRVKKGIEGTMTPG